MLQAIKFPISVNFDDGTTDMFDDVRDLECNLEHFDSEDAPGCTVFDAAGRRLVLRIELLELKDLRLAT